MKYNEIVNRKKRNGGSMKKMLLSLMLIISMFAFAAESSPSATVGYVKYGNVYNASSSSYNFIALPLDAGYTLASEIDPSGTNINQISYWDATGQGWVACDDWGGGFWDPDFAVAPGGAYMVNALQAHNFISSGSIPSAPTYTLVYNAASSSYNFIMHPLEKSALTMASALGDDIGICNQISYWDATGQGWSACDDWGGGFWDPDFASGVGNPLMLNVISGGSWPSKDGEYVDVEGIKPSGDDAPKGSRTMGISIRDDEGAVYDGFTTFPYDSVSFYAYIKTRPEEKLTQASVGSSYLYSSSLGISVCRVNIGNFATPYAANDSLVFVIQDASGVNGKVTPTGLTKTFNIPDILATMIIYGYSAGYTFDGPWSVSQPSGIEENSALPLETKLHQNYPNPFNPTTTIKFDLKQGGNVKLNVYNYNGQLVKALVNGEMKAGFQKVNFDASSLSAGVYYYTLQTAGKTMTQKMVLIK
jgi:hypothetical protein